MSAPRFFVSGVYAPNDAPVLAAEDARKLAVVLRKTTGDGLEIVDSSGRRYAATLELPEAGTARARLLSELDAPAAASLQITLAQGLPKGQKMDYVVEKATELGVAAVLAYTSSRTIGVGPRDGKLERWRRIAKSAAQQCGRSDVPPVDGPLTFADLVARAAAYDVALVPWELASPVPLHERLPPLVAKARTALIIIGPEGGLSSDEVSALEGGGASSVSLGRRILRTETAGLVACSALLYASGDL